MATLILSTIGSAYGGPVGGAIGALVGQQIDQLIIGPGKSREGPRLKELQLQTSSYGTQVPAIFGAMRVAGTVIWSTDLIETRKKSGGSKSRPATINYSYAASFAVALSSRPVDRVGRIWADGNLLRGSAADFKMETGFRFHGGHVDQPVDPLIASAVGVDACPAFRGIAYAVFEDMQLADYGNRIPSLTFELFESEGSVSISHIAKALSDGEIGGDSAETVAGYAAQGNDVEAALRPLVDILPVFVGPQGDGLQLIDWFANGGTDHDVLPVADVNGRSVDRPSRTRQPDTKLPSAIAIRHFEPLRDYQAGTQQSQPIGSGQNVHVLELPAANSAVDTKRFAELTLLQIYRARDGFEAHRLSGSVSTQIGDWLNCPSHRYRITEIEKFLDWQRVAAKDWFRTEPVLDNQTDAGVSVSPSDDPIGETQLILLDLPNLSGTDARTAQVFVAAAGTNSGWRRANLSLRDGDNLIDLGGTAEQAVMGKLVTPLDKHSPLLFDYRNRPVVRLLNETMELPLGIGDPLSRTAPLISLDGELIRYGHAEFLGGLDYRLHQLVRGVGGTDLKIMDHPAESGFVLLDPSSLVAVDPNFLTPGTSLTIEALGLADLQPVSQDMVVEANALRPLSPAHGKASLSESGDIALSWIRCDRIDLGWLADVDMPMSEGMLQFQIKLMANDLELQSWTVGAEHLVISASELAGLPVSALPLLRFEIRQVGRHALSRPLNINTAP